jgi:hypothetical protein
MELIQENMGSYFVDDINMVGFELGNQCSFPMKVV